MRNRSYALSTLFLLGLCLTQPGRAQIDSSQSRTPVPTRETSENASSTPAGLDVYRMWDKLPWQRIGERAYMRSTYDRTGGNEGADASHFLYCESGQFCVTLDVEGSGVLYFARYNHWHGSPWHYEVDGVDHIVQEPTTPEPKLPKPASEFLGDLFPSPLVWTHTTTKGADLMWRPIPFAEHLRMAYSRTHYGTGYYIYRLKAKDAASPQASEAWDWKTPPDKAVLDLVNSSGKDLAPKPGAQAGSESGVRSLESAGVLPANGTITLADLKDAPAIIRAIELTIADSKAAQLDNARLRVTWDGRAHPSIDAPVPLFYGAGTLGDRSPREYLVKGFPSYIRFSGGKARLACFWPMPFFRSARIELVNASGAAISGISWSVRYAPYDGPPNRLCYFHATYKDHPTPQPGQDNVFLDTRKVESGGEWSGHFCGTSWIFSHAGDLTTLEGDPRFFFDDAKSPQAYGTGTEEWGGGGDYWGGREMTLPFAGHPCGAAGPIESAYRFLIGDYMPFGRNAEIRLEHGERNESKEHYESVAYWYGAPCPTLVLTDSLDVGDKASEKAHKYKSRDASSRTSFTSRWDAWGVNSPEETVTGRIVKGVSEFNLALDPANLGALLRRELDYSYPNQRAEIYVADNKAGKSLDWQYAGVWYLAGSNRCVYSFPRGELGPLTPKAQISDRRLRDDEFLVPRSLTEGRSSIRVRVKFTPVERPLFPGHPYPEEPAWSELGYKAYCYVAPRAFDKFAAK